MSFDPPQAGILLQISQRGIHLLHQMFTKYPVHPQLVSVGKKELPSADSTMLQLHGMDEEDLGTMSLSQALQHIKPRSHLSQNKPQMYQIKPLKIPHTDRAPVAGRRAGQKMFKRLGRSKDFPLTNHGRAFTFTTPIGQSLRVSSLRISV